ncbi:MAG: argininosuccinate lyase [Candidatus Omnitrophica bacterium]|nr:argininosuccinate lyase [Candidatus Omnitrophota bacterium]
MVKKLWGGRFKKKIDSDFDKFQSSIQYDWRLAEYDIYHSMIHSLALLKMGVLKPQEEKKLNAALKEILDEIKIGQFKYNPESEDIHTEIQNRLTEKLGDLALKLHSFRSRNDQIVFDERYYCVIETVKILGLLLEVLGIFSELANKHKEDFFIGYTHTQRAQIIKFEDYLLAYYGMFVRDFERMERFLKNLEIPVGCGALAGSYIKKEAYKKAIEETIEFIIKGVNERYRDKRWFKLSENPLSDVSDRDFLIEFLSILSILQMHLSRLAEDLIIYSTKEFNFLILPEEFCTGSSLLPHKKNPDFLELLRGYTSRIYGDLVSLLTLMKGLPLAYNRDMQLDKEPLFSSVEIIKEELKILAKFIKEVKLNKKVISKVIKEDQNLYTTEVAEYLTEKGIPFLKAHEIAGKLIRFAEEKNKKIKELDNKILKRFSLNKKIISEIFNPNFVIKRRRSIDKEAENKLKALLGFKNA